MVRITGSLSTIWQRKIKSKENRQFWNNLIRILLRSKHSNTTNKRSNKDLVPSFYLINARLIFPKIDGLSLPVNVNVDVAAITESGYMKIYMIICGNWW